MEVKIAVDDNKYWDWCSANLGFGTWRKKIAIMGPRATYIFDNPEDATLFKLVLGLAR